MIGVVYTLLLLTLLFTLFSFVTLFFRRRIGGGAVMEKVWLFVLLLALIPMQFFSPRYRVVVTETKPVSAAEEPVILSHEIGARSQAEPVSEPAVFDRVTRDRVTRDPTGAPSAAAVPAAAVSAEKAPAKTLYTGKTVWYAALAVFVIWQTGAVICMAREMFGYSVLKRQLFRFSEPCVDERLLTVFRRCREDFGLRRGISLRVVDADCPTTPCVCGWIRPTVFVGAVCQTLDEDVLADILHHELCHIRRCDMLYKLFALTVFSVHWFNPTVKPVRTAVWEDNEAACDAAVLRHGGERAPAAYMNSILTVAALIGRKDGGQSEYGMRVGSALFMAQSADTNYLKRRYEHMKTICRKTRRRKMTVLSALFLTVMIAADALFMSSCGYIAPENALAAAQGQVPTDGDTAYEYRALDNALRNHFVLSNGEELTDEMLSSVKTVDVYYLMSEGNGADVPLFSFDGGESYQAVMPNIVTAPAFDGTVYPAVLAYSAEGSTGENTAAKKYMAFFALKDPKDPTLTPKAVQEMKLVFPKCEKTALYLFDPFATKREQALLFDVLRNSGLVDTESLTEDGIRADFAAIPALSGATLTFRGVCAEYPMGRSNYRQYLDFPIAYFELHCGDIESYPYSGVRDMTEEAILISYDANGDGVFDWNDFYDTNGDGTIDAKDYPAFDFNGDGIIEETDIAGLAGEAKQYGDINGEAHDSSLLFDYDGDCVMLFDKNGDGRIDEGDYPGCDRNGDGTVDGEDLNIMGVLQGVLQ